jgi:nucleotide-binding universal stress UspA family protein
MYERILIPTDGSDGTAHVALQAIDLARTYGSTVYVVSVVDEDLTTLVSELAGETRSFADRSEQAVKRVEAIARSHDVEAVTEVRKGDPAQAILNYAEEIEADLIVAGTHGRTGIQRRVVGSVAERLVRHADAPVMTVRLPESDVTVDDEAMAESLVREEFDERDYEDVSIDSVERQQNVWVVEATADGEAFLGYIDPITRRTSLVPKASETARA